MVTHLQLNVNKADLVHSHYFEWKLNDYNEVKIKYDYANDLRYTVLKIVNFMK